MWRKTKQPTTNNLLDFKSSQNYTISMMENRLKDIMEREKVSAYRVWKDLHIDQAQMSRFLNGKESMPVKKVEQIADYLGYDLVLVKRKHPKKGE